jgi:hypothetical protein
VSIDLNRVKETLTDEDQTLGLLDQVVKEKFGKVDSGSFVDAIQDVKSQLEWPPMITNCSDS